jgi:single-stranded DNA-binding protein
MGCQDGTTRYSTEIVTDQIKILEKREGRRNAAHYENRAANPTSTPATEPAQAPAANNAADESFEIDDLLENPMVNDDLQF